MHRALMICFESKLDDEIKFICMTHYKNGFPLNVVQTVIKNEMLEFDIIKLTLVQRCLVYLRLPWLGGISDRFAKQISQVLLKCYLSANV